MGAPYSGLMFAVRMTLAHFSLSLARNFPNSAGELGGSTNPPRSTRRALKAESEIAKLISYLHLAGQDQCRCDRLFFSGSDRRWHNSEVAATARLHPLRGQSRNQNRQVKLPLTEWSCARLASWPA